MPTGCTRFRALSPSDRANGREQPLSGRAPPLTGSGPSHGSRTSLVAQTVRVGSGYSISMEPNVSEAYELPLKLSLVTPTRDEILSGEAVLHRGHTGDAVRHVQRLLKVLGGNSFDDATVRAVQRFQRKHRVPV